MFTVRFCVTVSKMFFWRKAFQVFYSVIEFNTVNVMNMLFGVKRLHPAERYNAVHKVVASSESQVPVLANGRNVWLDLSESFSTARNSKKVVKESVLDSVYFYAQHAVPFKVAKES